MRTVLILTWAVALPLFAAENADVTQLLDELQGKTEALQRSPVQLAAAYASALESLMPGIGSDDIGERKGPQQALQAICWYAARPGAEQERLAVCSAMSALVGPETPRPARKWLLKQLEYIGRDECVEAVAPLLSDGDPTIRDCARRALQRNPSAAAGRALLTALGAARSVEWHIALINSLDARREKSAIPLLRKLADEPHPGIRTAAVQALASIGDAGSADLIAAARKRGAKRSRAAATDAYLKLADVLGRGDGKQQALGIYRELLEAEGHVRCAALIGISQVGGLDELPILFDALEDDDARVRGAAKQGLALLPAAEVNAAIIAKLATASPELKLTLVDALSRSDDPGILPVMMQAAKDADAHVRLTAIRAMGALGAEGATPVLVGIVARAEGEELKAAQGALARIPGDGVVGAIRQAMANAGTEGRLQLVRALVSRPGDATLALLENTATDDTELAVRVEALGVLEKFARAKSMPFLMARLLAVQEDQERDACRDAIAAVCWRSSDMEAVLGDVMKRYATAPKAEKVVLLPLFALVGGEEALAVVRQAQGGPDAAIREAALQTLRDWPDIHAADDLMSIARNAQSKDDRRLALRGYLTLVGAAKELPAQEALKRYDAAMAAAPGVEEKKLTLAKIGGVKDLAALSKAQAYLADKELNLDAGTAVLRIAESLRWEATAEAGDALRKLLGATEEQVVLDRAKSLLDDMAKYEGYVRNWVYSGPWQEKGQKYEDVLKTAFPPETAEANTLDWRKAQLGEKPETAWTVDFGRMDNGSNRAGYIRTWVRAEDATKARVEIGSDDGVTAWLNGKEIVNSPATRGVAPAQEQVEVELNKGWNSLLMKVTNAGSGWAGAARFRATDGGRLEGVLTQDQPEFVESVVRAVAGADADPQTAQVAFDTVIAAAPGGEESKALLRGAIKTTSDDALREKAQAMLDDYEKYEDHITAWQMAGPYFEQGKEGQALFDVAFAPEKPGTEVDWGPVKADGPCMVLLENLIGGDNRAAYLKSWIVSPREMKTQLEIGSDDAVKVWLNGELVHANDAYRAASPGQDKAPAMLRKGVNALLMKVTNASGHWAACLRVRAADGSHIEGLEYLSEEPE